MRLVEYLEIIAGGPGSGCHGDRCGRPRTGAEKSTRSASLLTLAPKDRESWPEHIKALKLPPAWTDVRIAQDPKADLQAVGKDAKGRTQYVYSAKYQETQAQLKFARIQELDAKFNEVLAQNKKDLKSKDPVVRDRAECARLIMAMGVRPGSDRDTLAKVKAYGATTLIGKHVVERKDGVHLKFTGKKGVSLDLPVTDPEVAAMLRRRAASAGPKGELFPSVSSNGLLDYTHSLDGGGFKTKDFRTLLGTREAMVQMKSLPAPSNMKEYKKSVMAVAKHVSSKLGNTPTIALQSYIHPAIFASWRSRVSA